MPLIDIDGNINDKDLDDNFDFLLSEINNLKSTVSDLNLNKADKSEIVRQIDLVASNIVNDTAGVSGYAVSNALLGLKNRIDNIIAQSGTSDTEVVDARFDSVFNTTYTVLTNRLDAMSQYAKDINTEVTNARADTVYGITNANLSDRLNTMSQRELDNSERAVYTITDVTNTNDYAGNITGLTLFDDLRLDLEVTNPNTGSATLDIGDGGGAKSIKFINSQGDKVDLPSGELFGVNALKYDGVDWVLLQRNFKESYVSVREFGCVGDGTDEYSKIQEAFNNSSGKVLFFNKQQGSEYLLSDTVDIPSNITIIFEPGTIIKSNAGVVAGIFAFNILEKENIKIVGDGVKINMVKANYTGEQNHTFNINSSNNIIIDGLNIFENGGDGIYIGGNPTDHTVSKNIVISNCTIEGSRRNNLSLTFCENVLVKKCEFINASGTNPQAGVDIEPNTGTYTKNITIKDCIARDNANSGFVGQFGADNCKFINCVSHDNVAQGFSLSSTVGSENKDNSLINCLSYNNNIGFYLQLSEHTIMENCISRSNASFGVQFLDSPDSVISKSLIEDSGARGLSLQSDNLKCVNNTIRNNGDSGIINSAGSNTLIESNHLTGNNNANITVSAPKTMIRGNIMRKGVEVVKPNYGIVIQTGATDLFITNNDLFDSGDVDAYFGSETGLVKHANIDNTGTFVI